MIEKAQDSSDQVTTLQDALEELPEHVVFTTEVQLKFGEILAHVAVNNPDKPYHNQEHAATVMKKML